ncbi:hypothetical protein E2562_006633 [Oryza meyeriana var. granulata]|uniref:Uncharacterized protein n=1 Tax=Oryza meyeriana var. granulata TaxID=110450 RepID=A0A6G1EI70_9ORYZ|nr:hypothetical protein E2562_006633 [Oryza meyeriana var. granulata]
MAGLRGQGARGMRAAERRWRRPRVGEWNDDGGLCDSQTRQAIGPCLGCESHGAIPARHDLWAVLGWRGPFWQET